MQEEIEKAKSVALRFLSYRIRSRKEIADKLKEKRFSKSTINTVIRDLKRINYINDYEFAKEFVASRLIHNPKSRKFLHYELLRKGIDNKIADQTITEKISARKEENIAKLLTEKVWNKKKNLETTKRKAQTYNYLIRRGFSASLAIKILEEISRQKE